MKIVPKRFSEQDVDTRVKWINNPLVNATMFFELPASVEKTKIWCASVQNNSSRIDFSFVNMDGEYLAMGGFTGISSEHKNSEFYVMVNPELQGKGIGKRVSQWMFNYAFSVLNLHKIYLYTNDDNVKAYKIYENSGFVLEGVLRQHKWKSESFQNRRFYGLLKAEWEEMEWKQYITDEV